MTENYLSCLFHFALSEVEQADIKVKGGDSVIIQVCEELIPSFPKRYDDYGFCFCVWEKILVC